MSSVYELREATAPSGAQYSARERAESRHPAWETDEWPYGRSAAGPAAQNPSAARSHTAAHWIRPILMTLVMLCALFLLGHFVGEPLTQIRHVTVTSDIALTDAQVLADSGIQGDEHWLTLRTAAVERKLEADPLIRHAVVRRIFPDTVRVTVWGRQPVALVLAQAGGRSLPILVDGEGVVFKVGASASDVDLPVISGLAVGDTVLGARLPAAYSTLFSDLKTLREKAPALYRQLSEVRLTSPQDTPAADGPKGELEALLYLTSSPVAVRIRGSVDETLMKYTLMTLDLLSKQGVLKDIQELDFRSGDVVYTAAGPAGRASGAPGATQTPGKRAGG